MIDLAMPCSFQAAVQRWACLAGIGVVMVGTCQAATAAALRLAQDAPAPAAAPVDPKPAEPKVAEPLGTPATVIDGKAAESLLGKKVQSGKGDDLGRIVDVIVDKAGQIRAAVIDFGGFLGVGSRKIAVDWHVVHMSQDGKLDHLVIDMPADQLRAAPAYKEGEPVVVLGPATDQSKATPAAPAAAPAPTPAAPAPTPPTQN